MLVVHQPVLPEATINSQTLGGVGVTAITADFNGDHGSDFAVFSSGAWTARSGKAPYSWTTPTSYNACNNGDSFYDVCLTANSGPQSYYTEGLFHADCSTSYNQSGIFVHNSDECAQGTTCYPSVLTHNWAKKINQIVLEFYSDGDPTVGGARLAVGCCSVFASGGVYTGPIGSVTLPKLGNSGSVYFNGNFTVTGNIGTRTFGLSAFGDAPGSYSSAGIPLTGFSATGSDSSGYYKTGPLYSGWYKTYIGETGRPARAIVVHLNNVNVGDIYNFAADTPCFGVSDPRDPNDDTHHLTTQDCTNLWAKP